MGMSFAYGTTDEAESLHVLRRCLELGGALAVQLTESDLEETDARFRQFAVAGERYTPEMRALVHG